MHWGRALAAWGGIVIAESVHGTIRQLWIAPVVGDLRARQIGVLIGSAIVFAIALTTVHWIDARTRAQQFATGLLWVALIAAFEFALGTLLGYSQERMLSDYHPSSGGFMGLGLLFMLCAPALAARVRGL